MIGLSLQLIIIVPCDNILSQLAIARYRQQNVKETTIFMLKKHFFFSHASCFSHNNKNYTKSTLRMQKKKRLLLDIVPTRIRKIITPYHTSGLIV